MTTEQDRINQLAFAKKQGKNELLEKARALVAERKMSAEELLKALEAN